MKGKVSVIMPVFLGDYEGGAKDRLSKFRRAINSFVDNDYTNKELIIVGDNCKLAEEILLEEIYDYNFDIRFINMPKKQKIFSGKLRTKGIELAKGEYIMYLDSDDILGAQHISNVVGQMKSNNLDWCYSNDYIMMPNGLVPKDVELEHGRIGTSSIAHINRPKLNWRFCNGYGHDWKFIKKLIKFSDNYAKVYGSSYIICHIPNQVDY
jgi:cellulose synthase/poly-beta-1,6-N-acetylglucosamine synthase-like glycosyltransferase